MAISTKQVIYIVVSLIVIATLLPIGLGLVSWMGNVQVAVNSTTSYPLSELVDPTVLTLLTTLLPILIVISVALYFVPRAND